MQTDRSLTSPRAIASIVLVSGLALAGCSSADAGRPAASADAPTSSTPPTSLNGSVKQGDGACEIVSDEVVSSVLGVDIVRREGKMISQGSTRGASCIKGLARSSDPSDFTFVSTSVTDEAGQGATMLDQAVSEVDATAVAGLGERAVFASSVGAVFIIAGDHLLTAQVTKAGKPGSLQDCEAVAEDMLGRLG